MIETVEQAIEFMREAHRSIGQMRRDGLRPYEVHPEDVIRRLVEANVLDEDTLCAAAGHDILEDVFPLNAKYSLVYLREQFGKKVSDLIVELTDIYTKENYPALNRKTRKQLQRECYAGMTLKARLVKLADICSNAEDEGGNPDAGFMRMYLKEKTLCLPYLAPSGTDARHPLYEQYLTLYFAAKRIVAAQLEKFSR